MASFDIGTQVLKRPHLLFSVIILSAVMGIIGFFSMPMNLFPDANYPQVVVIISRPGSTAVDIEDKVTRPVEKEFYSISLVRAVRSSSQDGMAAVAVEFDYAKDLDAAATDVANAFRKIEASLPSDTLPPRIFKVSDATAPVFTLALSPKKDSYMDLVKLRQLADNQLKEAFLRIPGVGDVEVFGGYLPEVTVEIDPVKLRQFGLALTDVILAINQQNLNIPDGLILRTNNQIRIKTYGEKANVSQLGSIVVSTGDGRPVLLSDIASIRLGYKDRQSLFMGNGKEAIGINILRPEKTGHVTVTIAALEKALPRIQASFPDVEFQIADTQKSIIETSIKNMAEALRDSILMTVAVIFLFLASLRLASLAAISIPLVCFMAFAGMYLLGYELNIVTMTAIILSVGLLVDDTIVVIENIQRHISQGKKTLRQAVVDGLNEIVLADWAGTFTTIIVLLPIMFVGGYPEKILRPLTVVLSLTLLSSFIVSVTIIPLMAGKLLLTYTKKNFLERGATLVDRFMVSPLKNFFVLAVRYALKRRMIFIIMGVIALILSIRQIPLVGRDLMPSMDTGIVKVAFKVESNSSIQASQKVAEQLEKILHDIQGLKMTALMMGTEPGVVSFGTGRTPQSGIITAHYIDRFHRDKTIWEIEDIIRKHSYLIPGIISVSVYDFGATPLSSIAAPVDIMISGADAKVLDALGNKVLERLRKVKGLTAVERSWTWDKREAILSIDSQKAGLYGITVQEISAQIRNAVEGQGASILRIPGEDGYLIRVRHEMPLRNSFRDVMDTEITTPRGLAPLSEFGTIEKRFTRTLFTRKDLMPTIDIYGYRATTSISHLHEGIVQALQGLDLPKGYVLSFEGEYKNMGETVKPLAAAMGIAVILLFFSLVITFRSILNPLVIMVAIPISLIGVAWGLLLVGRHMCMPAMMGMILLTGIVVNNSILLIDFIEQARSRGQELGDAIAAAVRMRARPIFMTVACTVVGMWPVAAQRALGLERLSPLAVVAIGGLIVSTLLTLVYVPVFYSLVDDLKEWMSRDKGRIHPG